LQLLGYLVMHPIVVGVVLAISLCGWTAAGSAASPVQPVATSYSVVCRWAGAHRPHAEGNVTCSVQGGAVPGATAVATYSPAMNATGWDVYQSAIVDPAGLSGHWCVGPSSFVLDLQSVVEV
jgi:hypothetical protein